MCLARRACRPTLAALGGLATYAMPVAAALQTRRGFYSGLDDNRVHRLRRSGMTFNKPRGRDTLSLAFESRIRVLPLNTIGDLYGPVEPPSHHLNRKREPSLPGPPEREEGEDPTERTREGQGAPTGPEGAGCEGAETEWRVLVVEPMELWQVERPLLFPAVHPSLYADWSASQANVLDHKPLARHLLRGGAEAQDQPPLQLGGYADSEGGRTGCGGEASVDPAEAVAAAKERFFHLAASNRRHLHQNGDTTLIPSSFRRRFQRPPRGNRAGEEATTQHVRFFLSVVIDPFIDVERFRREEAQVEMISGFRNVFYEAVELPELPASTSGVVSGGSARGSQKVADVVRIPALSLYSCGPRFFHEIGKLNQQSIIKGFHRISNEAKEQLITNKNFTVELYVPPLLLDDFEKAFDEEAWEAPVSTLNPGRTALYPGLAPPRTLLTYDGWIGKRPELIEAIETEGKSLMHGKKYALDGSEVREQEVLSHIRVFGAREEEAKRLAAERQTAVGQLGQDHPSRHEPEPGSA